MKVQRRGASPAPHAPALVRVAAGDDPSAAMAALLHQHGEKIFALALRMCRHSADAQDMVQDVFLQGLRKWHTFRGESDPGTWLYAIAARSCKARMRRKGGIDRRTPAISQLMPWNETTVMEVAAASEGEENQAERNEALERVQAEIARLPEFLRAPVVLKEVMGLSVEDTAAALNLLENTVKTRLHRARLALRKAMTAKARAAEAPLPIYEKQVCLDLLKAKMEAMDRGSAAAAKIPQAELCARCRAVFREFDLVQDACASMSAGPMPEAVRKAILAALERRRRDEPKSAARSTSANSGRNSGPSRARHSRSRR